MATTMPSELQFDADKHEYRVNGVIIPSVTEVLRDVGIIDYTGLAADIREQALFRGRAVHLATAYDDEYVAGLNPLPLDESTVSDEHMGYVEAWRKFRRENEFTPSIIEKPFYNRLWGYVGTPDCVGKFNGRAFNVIIDKKTGAMDPWVRYQMAAYAEFFDNPRSYLRVAVELHSDTTYKAQTVHAKNHAVDFGVFSQALAVYWAKRATYWD